MLLVTHLPSYIFLLSPFFHTISDMTCAFAKVHHSSTDDEAYDAQEGRNEPRKKPSLLGFFNLLLANTRAAGKLDAALHFQHSSIVASKI